MAAVTETPNALTMELDRQDALGIVRLLRQVDAQMFAGWEAHPALTDTETLRTVCAVAGVARDIALQAEAAEARGEEPRAGVVLSGCGTSGRIAFLVARTLNAGRRAAGKAPLCRYLCAGGDKALFTSQEAPEDNWRVGVERLREAVQGLDRVLYIGITCGLSAPFVASQLDHALGDLARFTPVLLGFNPVDRARAVPIEGWGQTFRDVVDRLVAAIQPGNSPSPAATSTAVPTAVPTAPPRGYVLNPVVGPEALTGSTRMKGGSATKILLELCLVDALLPAPAAGGEAAASAAGGGERATSPPPPPPPPLAEAGARARLAAYQTGVAETYGAAEGLSAVVGLAGEALCSGGRLTYLGWGALGIAGLVDASECPPTYNARFEDIRAFLCDGYEALGNDEGSLEHLGEAFRMGWDAFADPYCSTLSRTDLLLVLDGDGMDAAAEQRLQACCRAAAAAGSPLCLLSVRRQGSPEPDWHRDPALPWAAAARVRLSASAAVDHARLAELAAKLLCNAVTTGAHVLKGKVVMNRMVDLQVSNNKLFFRSVGIVALLSAASTDVATASLLRAIHNSDQAAKDPEVLAHGISEHVRTAVAAAAAGRCVVPTAILLASRPGLSVAEATSLLAKTPVVRAALAAAQALP